MVHDVTSMTKLVLTVPTTRGPSCSKTQTPSRNLHLSGFTLAGRMQTRHSFLNDSGLLNWLLGGQRSILHNYIFVSSPYLQEIKLMTMYLIAPLRGLWHLQVVDPALCLYPKIKNPQSSPVLTDNQHPITSKSILVVH